MLVRLPLLLLAFIISSPCIASFHLSNNTNTPSLTIVNQQTMKLPAIETLENFSTLLQRRILQILAHQLIDDSNQVNTKKPKHAKTYYKTKTFSVSIDAMNTAFYRVSIKDNLQNKETLIKIPR